MGHSFLRKKFTLHRSSEVDLAAKRTKARTDKYIPEGNADARVQNYLDRLRQIFDREDPEKRDRGIEAFKEVMYRNVVVKPEEIPDGYFEHQREIARQQGHGDIEITDQMRDQLTEVIIADQKSSFRYLGGLYRFIRRHLSRLAEILGIAQYYYHG